MSSFFRGLFSNFLSHFFQNIPRKSYRFECDDVSSKYEIRLNQGSEFVHCHKYPDKFEAFFVSSSSGNTIACLMIKLFERPSYTILFNHGGTVDLGNLCNYLFTFGQRLGCNVLVYDYSGFGQSSGTPTEKAVYADAETVLQLLLSKYHIAPEKIVIYGQSLGTAPTLHLARTHPVKAAILHSPFLSICKLFFSKANSSSCHFYDFYKNIEMIGKVELPILVLHGTNDRVVPISHAKELHKHCLKPVTPLWVEGGDHDDLYAFDGYMKRLKRFFEFDLAPSK